MLYAENVAATVSKRRLSMFPEVRFKIENDTLIIENLSPHLQLRRINYSSQNLATLKRISVASVNILAAKFYMDAIPTAKKDIDPHFVDAALLAAIVKYACVFKADITGKSIDPRKIFIEKTYIVNRTLSEEIM